MGQELEMIKQVVGEATAENRKIAEGNQRILNEINARIDGIEAGKNRSVLYGGTPTNNDSKPEIWNDANGHEVPVLAPNHKLSVYAQAPAGAARISPAQYLKGLFGGTSDTNIKNALSEGTDAAGGYSVPDYLSSEIIDNARAKSHVISAGAKTVSLATEKTMITKIASDPTVAWRLENAAIAESEPTFAGIQFQARSLAVLVKVSRELLEDSLNIGEALNMALAGAIGAELDRVCLMGTGVAPQPTGILNTAGINTVSMGTNGLVPIAYTQLLTA
jgi:HK97 family phage major capsid protein